MFKRLLLLAIIFQSAVLILHAQSETLLSGDIDHGGFGGIKTHFSQISGESAVMVGGFGAWLIDHTIALGLGGQGLTNDIFFDRVDGQARYIRFEYGGVYLGYFHNSDKLVHFTIETIIGNGQVNMSHRGSDNKDLFDDDNVFVIDPQINVELNITNFMRFTVGAGYRYVSGVDIQNLRDQNFSSPTLNATVRFGSF